MNRDTESIDVEMHRLLYCLGILPNHVGYFYMIDALRLITADPQRLLLVTKAVYPDVALRYHTTAQAVERGMRTAACAAWRSNPALLQEMAGYPLCKSPGAGCLLAILCGALLHGDHIESGSKH